jgi:uncharacterized glyoxalase superfamily protein PhnB
MHPNRSVPPATVIPVLTYTSVTDASDWLCHVFGFRERLRIGSHRAQLMLGDGAVIIHERRADPDNGSPAAPELWPPHTSELTHSVLVRVDDVDQHHARASQRGARIVQPPTDFPYGERQYAALDPGGHLWTFSQSIADIDPASLGFTVGTLE